MCAFIYRFFLSTEVVSLRLFEISGGPSKRLCVTLVCPLMKDYGSPRVRACKGKSLSNEIQIVYKLLILLG